MSSQSDLFNEQQLDLDNLNCNSITVSSAMNIASAVIDSLPTDNSTIQYSSNQLSVKQVDTAQIKDGAITSSKLAAGAVNANSLSGTTLASNVVNSSLTSLGTLTGLNLNGNLALLSTGLNLGSNTIPLTYLYTRNVYSDASLNLYAGYQVVSHSDIYPSSISINIGSAFNKFNSVYALMFYGDCSGNAATATTSSACSGNAATSSSCTGNAATATTASSCSGNAATSSSCTGNAATATTASACSGNALTATTLQTGRTINGTTFDGSANITITADANTLTNTTLHSTVVSSSLTSLGTLTGLTMGGNITFNASTYNIGDGSHGLNAIVVNYIDAPGDLTFQPIGNLILSTGNNLLPATTGTLTVGSSSKAFYEMHATTFYGALSGNSTTATTLQTGRTINGTTFDGSSNITITSAGSTLTGSSLASGITSSSLTSVGTISSGTWNGSVVGASYGGTGQNLSVNPVMTLQVVRTTSGAAQSLGASTASYNNTIPTYSSLNNITGLQTSFTPKSSSSTLTIKVIVNFTTSALEACVFGLFNGTGSTNALQTAVITAAAANYGSQAVLFYAYAPGSTSAITFYVAGGGTSGSSVFINANSSGTRLMGGVLLSSVEIKETTS